MTKHESLLKGYKEPVEPRPSCAERLRYSRQLQHMLPGYSGIVNAVYVRRTTRWTEYTYWINDVEQSLEQTIDVILGKTPTPVPTAEIFQFDLRIESEEAKPRKLHSRKPRTPKAKPAVELLSVYTLPLFALLPVSV